MKTRIFLLLLFLPCFATAQNRLNEIYEKITDAENDKVIVVAHRADWRNFPENSLEAMESAIEMGVDVIELDLRKTKDGHIIVMHDKTLDRTTTGTGNISDWNLADIKNLYLKNGANIKTKHRVPTLKEAMLVAKDKVMINLDKAEDIFDDIYPILKETGTTKQIIMKGKKSPTDVQRIYGRYLDEIIYMPIIHLDKEGAMKQVDEFMNTIKPKVFEFLFVSDTCRMPFIVKEKLENKSKIWYNTLWDTMAGGHDDDMALNDIENAYGYLIYNLGATMIQTDRPQLLLHYLQNRNLHP